MTDYDSLMANMGKVRMQGTFWKISQMVSRANTRYPGKINPLITHQPRR